MLFSSTILNLVRLLTVVRIYPNSPLKGYILFVVLEDNIVFVSMSVSIVNMTLVLELAKPCIVDDGERRPNFSGTIVRFCGLTFLIFKSCRVVCVGGKNMADILETIDLFLEFYSPGNSLVKVEPKNIVGSKNVGTKILMDQTYNESIKNGYQTIYEPELFASVRIYLPNCLVSVFGTGKFTFTGAKQKNHIYEAWETVKPIIKWKRAVSTGNLNAQLQ